MGYDRRLLVRPEILEHFWPNLAIDVSVSSVCAKRRIDLDHLRVLQPVGVRCRIGRAQPDIIVVRIFANLDHPDKNGMFFEMDRARVDDSRIQQETCKQPIMLALNLLWGRNRGRKRGGLARVPLRATT